MQTNYNRDLALSTTIGMSNFLETIPAPCLEILFIMFHLQRPLSRNKLSEISHRGRCIVSNSLIILTKGGYIEKVPFGYVISGTSRQMLFSTMIQEGGQLLIPSDKLMLEGGLLQSRGLLQSPVVVDDSLINNRYLKQTTEGGLLQSPPDQRLHKALCQVGILQPVRDELLTIPGLTPAVIFSHYFELKKQKSIRSPIGLLVNLLRNFSIDDRIPRLPSDFCPECFTSEYQHSETCSKSSHDEPAAQNEIEQDLVNDCSDAEPEVNELLEKIKGSFKGDLSLNNNPKFFDHLDQCSDIFIMGDEAVVSVDSEYSCQWLNSRAARLFSNALIGITGSRMNVIFKVVGDG